VRKKTITNLEGAVMQSRNAIVPLAVLGSLLAGCNCATHRHDEATGPRATELLRGEGAQIGQNAPADGLPPCAAQAAPGVSGPQDRVTSGTYCVCDIGTHDVHDSREGKHLEKDQAVVIDALDWVTHVQLGASNLQMNRSADSSELSAQVSYKHEDVISDNASDITHLVRIMPSSGANTQCDQSRNILKISFCVKGSDGKWACGTRVGGHLGDTHVQN
jgi:hypothetical protein